MNPIPPNPHLTSTPLDTSVSAVTVYTNQASVTRRGTVTLSGQEGELAIANLPATLHPDSVRVRGTGTVAVRLLGVRTKRIFATEPVAEQIAQLTEQIKHLEHQHRAVQDALTALHLQRGLVQTLGEKAGDRISRSLTQQQMSLSDTEALLTFVGQRYGDLSGAIAQRDQELTHLNNQVQALRQQLQQIKTLRSKESYSLIVSIQPDGAGEFELELSYTVEDASWRPLYDLRVDTTNHRLSLSYLAEVRQLTGEDWTHIALTLSTAKPGLGTLPPKPDPWYVDVIQPVLKAASMAGVRRREAVPGMVGDNDEQFEINASMTQSAPSVPAQTLSAEVRSDGGVVTFQVGGNTNIPGDGAFHKIAIFSGDYPCQFEYVAIPRLVSFAYLQAVVVNPTEGATLLPGKATIFRDTSFVGTTQLNNISPGQEFKLNLGIDEGLNIQRELVEREVDKRLLGGNRRITYAYRLTITNLRNQDATLKLTEQLPVSRNEQIKVRLTNSRPQTQPGEMGLLDWLLNLKSQAKQEIYYQFVVEYPPGLTVVGLNGTEISKN